MRELSTDVAIIGAGSAGLNARREVERAGRRWLLIEGGEYGTTCARTGCMPSKLLIAAAEVARKARRAAAFGVNIAPGAIAVDGRAVLARLRAERDRFVRLTAQDAEQLPAALRVHGRARWLEPNVLAVDDHTRVYAEAVVIAVGSQPNVPDSLTRLGAAVLTTDSVFSLPDLPRSIAIFGTGAIGLELGQAFDALGVRVAFYNPNDSLGPFTDPVVAAEFRALAGAHYELALGTTPSELKVEAGEVVIRHRSATGHSHEGRFERVLAAAGRTPALRDLGLERAGIELDEHGTPVFDPETMQCGTAPVFIAGDAAGFRPLLHESVAEGCIAGANAARFPDRSNRARMVPLTIAFTHPQLAIVGQNYATASRGDIVIGEASYADQGRARINGENAGHVRVYISRTDQRLRGAELFGPSAEHTAHLLAWAMQASLDLRQLLGMPVYHPTVEEGIRTALRDAAGQLALLQGCAPADRATGPGA